jgi:hypothetical protein
LSTKFSVTDSHEFQQGLAFAKGLAVVTSQAELSAATMAAGFVLFARATAPDIPPIVLAALDHLTEIVEGAQVSLPSEVTPVSDKSFPLTADLQQIFRQHGSSLDAFLSGLIKTQRTPRVSLTPAFEVVMRHASSAAGRVGATTVGAEAFAAGAYLAFQAGDLTISSALAAHVAVNVRALEALIEKRGFLRGAPPPASTIPLPLADEFRAVLGGGKGSSLIAALNPGLEAGAKILSKHRVAYHEAGHAVVSHILRPELPVMTVSIIDKGDADGTTSYDPGSPFWSRLRVADLMTGLCVSLAGRAAERIKFGQDEVDSGASADLTQATRLAWKGITRFGLDHGYCPIDLTCLGNEFHVSTGWLYDEAQRRLAKLLREAATRSEEVLKANWSLVEALVVCLRARQQIEFEDFIESLRREGLTSLPRAIRAKAKPVERRVTFAEAPGMQVTAEGPVRYDAGDALVVAGEGPAWPVRRHIFDQRYEPAAGQRRGEPGVYRKVAHWVTALQIEDVGRVDLTDGRGVLMGQRGDWLVDYGENDISVVSAESFARSYSCADA